jgi:hypothetical protein
MYEENSKDSSVIYYNGKVYDEKKRAIYGIQKCNAYFWGAGQWNHNFSRLKIYI